MIASMLVTDSIASVVCLSTDSTATEGCLVLYDERGDFADP